MPAYWIGPIYRKEKFLVRNRPIRFNSPLNSFIRLFKNIRLAGLQGAVLSNAHLEIPQIKEYLTNVYQLAEASAELWNIRYETEGLLL